MNKALFGAYLNAAQHNTYMILNHINQLIGEKDDIGEGNLANNAAAINLYVEKPDKTGKIVYELIKNVKPETVTYTLKLLYLHFPFLAMLVPHNAATNTNDYQKVCEIIKNALVRLNNERNINSHFLPQVLESKSYLTVLDIDKLQTEFIAPFLQADNHAIKRRYPFIAEVSKTKALAAMQSQAAKEQEITIKAEALLAKFGSPKQNKKDRSKEVASNISNINATNPQKDNSIVKYLQDYQAKNNFWHNAQTGKGREFSEKGLVYFLCLFLERKQAYLLLNSVSGFKNTAILEYRAVRDMFAHNCCKLPQPRLDSSDILLDMLNELNRCPKTLYNLLSETDQKHFNKEIDNSKALIKRNDENGELLEFEKQIRHQDRFPYFALRYFDDTNAFPKMRFQLYIGKLLQQEYPKTMQGQEGQRQILKEIHAFGKLSDFLDKNTNKLHKTWQEKIFTPEFTIDEYGFQQVKNTPKKGNIVQFSPQYNLGTNKIAIKIGGETTKPIRQKKNQKGVELDFIENEKPTAIISTNEFPNLFLYHYLHKQGLVSQTAEEFIEDYCKKFRSFIQAVQKGEFTPLEKTPFQRRKVSYKDKKEAQIKKTQGTGKEPYNEKNFKELSARKAELQTKLDNHPKFKGLHWSFLPDDIVHFLIACEKPTYKKQVLGKIEEMKDQTNDLKQELKRITNKQINIFENTPQSDKNKIAWLRNPETTWHEKVDFFKKNPVINEEDLTFKFRVGEIASWLAKDIIFFKPYSAEEKKAITAKRNNPSLNVRLNPDKKGKPNNDQYNRLQTMLALYPIYKAEIPKFFRELGLIGGEVWENHPFLAEESDLSLYYFYQNYVEARAKWLVKLHTQVDGVKSKDKATGEIKTTKEGLSPEKIAEKYGHLFGAISQTEKSITEKKYTEIPIALPVGLFNAVIMEGMKKKDTSITEKDNTIFAIKTLVKSDTQFFYNLQRNYESVTLAMVEDGVANVEKMASLKIEIEKLAKSTKEQDVFLRKDLANYRNEVLSTEKDLRFTQNTDRCLWLMSQELTKFRKENTQEGIQLDFADTSLQKLETLLDTEKEMKLQVYIYEIKPKKALGIVADTLPLRRYGDLRRFAKNRQLPNLYAYFYDENKDLPTFTPQALQDSLDFLETQRMVVLDKALDLEQVIHAKLDADFALFHQKDLSKQHIDHSSYIEYLFTKLSKQTLTHITGEETDAETIYKLRNRIIHNEIPHNTFLHNHITTKNLSTPEEVVKAIIEKAIDIYQKLIEECEKV
jgi:hypothetical protein